MATTQTEAGGDALTVINIGPRGLDHYLKAVEGQLGNPRVKCGGRSLLVSPGPYHGNA